MDINKFKKKSSCGSPAIPDSGGKMVVGETARVKFCCSVCRVGLTTPSHRDMEAHAWVLGNVQFSSVQSLSHVRLFATP